jgi:hypothetical protein
VRALRGPLKKKDAHLWERHPQDWYVEPEWVNDQLFTVEQFEGLVYDPACGMGRIVDAAIKAGLQAIGSDLMDRCGRFAVVDFLTAPCWAPDNIACNPPYGYVPGICEQFVYQALLLAKRKVAMLLPSGWVQGEDRARWLRQVGLKTVYFICPRPSMPPGPVIEAGVAPGSGTTDYAWYVFERGHVGEPTIGWLFHPLTKAERRSNGRRSREISRGHDPAAGPGQSAGTPSAVRTPSSGRDPGVSL